MLSIRNFMLILFQNMTCLCFLSFCFVFFIVVLLCSLPWQSSRQKKLKEGRASFCLQFDGTQSIWSNYPCCREAEGWIWCWRDCFSLLRSLPWASAAFVQCPSSSVKPLWKYPTEVYLRGILHLRLTLWWTSLKFKFNSPVCVTWFFFFFFYSLSWSHNCCQVQCL